MMVSVDEVKDFTGIDSKHFKSSAEDDSKLDKILTDWISQSEDLIKSYTHNKFSEEETPGAVKNVCLRLTANMVSLAIERRNTPRTKVTDWKIQVSSSEIFTDDLKADLEPYVIEHSNKSDKIDFFAITGDE